MIHFICPAYFLKKNANEKIIITKIKSTIRTGDDIGIYLQPWKSLTDRARVKFRDSKSFWGNKIEDIACETDCGSEIPLNTYEKDEVGKILETSIKTLKDLGFGEPKSFSVGGWQSSKSIYEVAYNNNLKYSFSAASPQTLKKGLQYYPIFGCINQIWHNITPSNQPFIFQSGIASIIEFGNSGMKADYLTAEDLVELFREYLRLHKEKPDSPLYFHIGIHQETAYQFTERLISAFERIHFISQKESVFLKQFSLPDRNFCYGN
ncbi:MAG: hypothetical protein HQK54_00175 [Oligoflexales bacterium]|nr:hypothetical protein [Oligoflexales bacterium]